MIPSSFTIFEWLRWGFLGTFEFLFCVLVQIFADFCSSPPLWNCLCLLLFVFVTAPLRFGNVTAHRLSLSRLHSLSLLLFVFWMAHTQHTQLHTHMYIHLHWNYRWQLLLRLLLLLFLLMLLLQDFPMEFACKYSTRSPHRTKDFGHKLPLAVRRVKAQAQEKQRRSSYAFVSLLLMYGPLA